MGAQHDNMAAEIAYIAKVQLRIETISSRGTDALDFHEISVAALRDAIAYAIGKGVTVVAAAGNETTTKLLANAVYWAHEYRPQLDRVLADPDLVPLWTEETLRFDNSTQMVLRRVAEDYEVNGTIIPAAHRVLLLVGSANRDAEVFGDDADQYILGRDVAQNLMSFGIGTHFCLGAHLARLESNIGLEEVARSVSNYEIDLENAVRVHSVNVRGFANLPMKVQAR